MAFQGKLLGNTVRGVPMLKQRFHPSPLTTLSRTVLHPHCCNNGE